MPALEMQFIPAVISRENVDKCSKELASCFETSWVKVSEWGSYITNTGNKITIMFAGKDVLLFPKLARFKATAPNVFVNRNPRNLEQMRIARKPDGYHLEKPGRKFWHKLVLSSSNRAVTAEVIHYVNGPVITAKTSEQALRNQLYSITDTCAYINLGKVFAQRCLECGITEMHCNIEPLKGGKVEKFLEQVVKGGIQLKEMEVYSKPQPWDKYRPEKPWEVNEE